MLLQQWSGAGGLGIQGHGGGMVGIGVGMLAGML
jgi:hypothetical protein